MTGAARTGYALNRHTGRVNPAARAGRWSAAHWKTAFVAWICLAAFFYLLGTSLGTVNLADADTGSGETARAQSILKHANFTQKATEEVLVRARRSPWAHRHSGGRSATLRDVCACFRSST